MLPADLFRRLDESPDTDFYAMPRLVTHIDDATIAALTALYRERIPAGAREARFEPVDDGDRSF